MWTEALRAVLAVHAAATAVAVVDAPLETREAGRLVVAVYRDFAPYAQGEQGIDVDIAKALAAKLGLALEIRDYPAADDVDGDLRNIVWRGHPLWKGRLADVMMHVPVDPHVMKKNGQVQILAPYFRERLVIARSRTRIPQLPTLQVFTTEKIGVQVETVEDRYLVSSFGGLLRDNVVHYASASEATAALLKGEVAAVMGRQSVIEAALGSESARFEIAAAPAPGLATTGWELGLAVKAESTGLAAALQRAMADLVADGSIERIFAKRSITYRSPSTGL
ncbi:MAG TPA: transporter substrate-binding domain-containing protein [Candidatus Limnocylindrales bacterium]